MPEVLATGLPSALWPNKDPGAQVGSSFEYLFAHPDENLAPGLFQSTASLTGQLTWGDILSDTHDYFSLAPSWGLSGTGPNFEVRRRPREASFPTDTSLPTDSGEPNSKKARQSAFPWTDLSLPSSQ